MCEVGDINLVPKRTGYYKLHVTFEKRDRFKGSRLVHGTVPPNRDDIGQ